MSGRFSEGVPVFVAQGTRGGVVLAGVDLLERHYVGGDATSGVT